MNIPERIVQTWFDAANDADYDFMRWSDFLATMAELKHTDTPAYDPVSGDPSFGGGGPIPINDLLAADGTNTIDNTSYSQEWQWSTLAGAGPHCIRITSTSIGTNASSTLRPLYITASGANTNSSVQTNGIQTNVTNTGTTNTNSGGFFDASGASSNNYGTYCRASGSNGTKYGTYANGGGLSGNKYGIYATTTGESGTNYAVYGDAVTSSATKNVAGFFNAEGATTNVALSTQNGNVGFGTSSPAASSLVEMSSTTQGLLPPRMTTTQMNAISSPATGLMIYNTTENKIAVHNGSGWNYLSFEV